MSNIAHIAKSLASKTEAIGSTEATFVRSAPDRGLAVLAERLIGKFREPLHRHRVVARMLGTSRPWS
jgi:hypothetical protein